MEITILIVALLALAQVRSHNPDRVEFNGLEMGLGNLARLSKAPTR